MKNYIFNSAIAAGLVLSLASCGENTWNDKYLDGFEGGVDYNKPSKVEGEYTLTAADYKAISKAILATGELTAAEEAEAKGIETLMAFDKNGFFPASIAVPYLLATPTFPYYLDAVGSNSAITYDEYDEVPAELAQLGAAGSYKVSKADYQGVWGSDENYIDAFAPAHTAEAALPAILLNGVANAKEGDYVKVSYNSASTNPVFGNVGEDNSPKTYLNETFAEGMGDFTLDNVKLPEGSTYVWKHDTYKGDSYMKASAYVGGSSKASEGWLLSPEMKLSANANAVLTYDQAWKNFASVADAKVQATVWVKEVGGTWVEVKGDNFPENTSYDFYNSGKIDLSAFNGKNIQVGFKYTSTTASSGTWEVKNVVVADAAALAAAAKQSRAAVADVPSVVENVVYYFDGSKWAPATGVSMLNPADYDAMGFKNNSLSDADVYIPMYLKSKLPYALSDDQRYVVYNNNKVDLFVFDGSVWTLNNNARETVKARFNRKSTGWTFVKYLGKAVFNFFNEEELTLDRSYLLVFGDQCAKPVTSGKTYGYLYMENITITDGVVVLNSDANAFEFLSAYYDEDSETTYECPEGFFLIHDSEDRYFYLAGSFNSPNLTEGAPTITDGKINETFLFNAKKNDDGTWSIMRGEQTMHLSPSFSSVGFYTPANTGAEMVKPVLYILD